MHRIHAKEFFIKVHDAGEWTRHIHDDGKTRHKFSATNMLRLTTAIARQTIRRRFNHYYYRTMTHTAPAIVAPSLLSCDLANIDRDATQMLEMGADWLHMDIMDGHFVPNLSFGPPVIASLRKAQKGAYLDCHLMVSQPANWVGPMAKAGASSFNFHYESEMPEGGHKALIQSIKDAGMKVGMTVKPGTPIDSLYEFVDDLDMVLIMTVEPGFSGQKFMGDQMSKVEALRKRCPDLNIQVDGGLSPSTVDAATQAGANVIVAASAIFGSDDRAGVINALRESVVKHGHGK